MLGIITKIGKDHDKVVALTETGYRNTPQADWWTKNLQSVIEQYPISYVLVWRNAWDNAEENFGPAPEKSCAKDFRQFYKSPKTLFVKDLK
jgi:mannan endo-1,4-beta-mannosidase